ncbi:porin family protein [Hymenobacter properus]|uniref:PorT family protein n=1 Tax=Hymenobacter properus TaxID=2791026 RepID=A0A931BG33_9BACT|nr:porin family protein [Hymenobacter properus]MBF9140632.1 PorT family protein [Hymenobacter properus]MBR7719440.1 PorT family protein [Microvirga sp. SRT04]
MKQFLKQLLLTGVAASGVLLATSAQAQVSFGPRVGLNVSTLSYDFDTETEPTSKYKAGAQVGVSLNAQFGKLSVQPSLLFTMKGNKSEITDSQTYPSNGQTFTSTYHRNQTFNLNYLELPVNLVYSTNGAEGGFQVFAGPYVAMGLGGNTKADFTETNSVGGVTQTQSGSFDVDVAFVNEKGNGDKAYLRRFDAGFNFGIGYKIAGIQAQAGYGLGLGNLFPNDKNDPKSEDKLHNRGFQIAVSYFLQKP